MSKSIFNVETGTFVVTITDPNVPVDTAMAADYVVAGENDSFTCQVTASALNATPNSTTEDVPATMCEAGESRTIVQATSYELALTFLQDPNVAMGLSRFLYKHDTEIGFFYFAMNGTDGEGPPKAIGALRIQSGSIGGEMRTTLTSDLTLPVTGKPDVMFGSDLTTDVVEGNWRGALGLPPFP
jgi:hypothetical protein